MVPKTLHLLPYDGTAEIVGQIKRDASQEVSKFHGPVFTGKSVKKVGKPARRGKKFAKKGRSSS